MSFGPFLASVAFGFLKGFTSNEQSEGFRAEQDFIGPVKEEFLYRGMPLWMFPNLPVGTTAVTFAVDHVISDARKHAMTPLQMVARLGDVFLGGYLYESAFRGSGIAGAIASHIGHNASISVGQRLRNGRVAVAP